MDPALRIAASGMAAQQTRTDIIANNLANVSTNGFKSSRANFTDLLYQNLRSAQIIEGSDAGTIPEIQVGRGTQLASVQRIHSQGTLEQTDRKFDLAIEGDGFLQVQLPNGQVGYTRDGNLELSDQGVLTTSDGNPVLPNIRIPADATDVIISKTGIVSVQRGSDASQLTEVGRIELARFLNPVGLQAMGGSVYQATPSAGEPILGMAGDDGFGKINQGALEGSNVSVVQEMVDMISAMRAYELNSKAVKSADDMMSTANGLVR